MRSWIKRDEKKEEEKKEVAMIKEGIYVMNEVI